MGKTRNLNGDDVVNEENSTFSRYAPTNWKILYSFIRRISTEEEDEVFVNEEDKKMKKSSKTRTILFIPGFHKSKKTKSLENVSSEEMPPFKITSKHIDTDFILLKSSHDKELNSSSRSSISSLDTLVSVDSGIDCTQISSTSSLSSFGSTSSFSDVMRGRDPVPCGRAPIASPEDDKLSDEACTSRKENDTSDYENLTFTHNNSSSSFCTLSDNNSACSCDSCCESDLSDSDSEDCLHQPHEQSDSDSDLDSRKRSSSQRRLESDSDSDSDSDDGQSDFFSRCSNLSSLQGKMEESRHPAKKVKRSNSKLNLSLRKLVRTGSKLDLSIKKIMRGSSKSDVRKEVKKENKIKVPELKSSPKRILPWRPAVSKPKNSAKKNSTSINEVKQSLSRSSCDVSALRNSSMDMNSSSLLIRSDSDSNGSFRGPSTRSGIKLGVKKLQRSKSDCSTKPRPVSDCHLNTSQPVGDSRTTRQLLSNSPVLQVRSHSFIQDACDIDIDTCKSPLEVRQAMQKTAFWIENNDYDKTPDVSSTESLMQSRDVTESDLCDQIIGIYFGDENDSDSSLSSSCLDNSMETSIISDENSAPVTSTLLETNLDDFSMATFVPAPYQTAKAKTRKISIAEPTAECTVKQAENITCCRKGKEVLREHVDNSVNKLPKHKTAVVKPPPQNRRSKMLSEEEIDTITKIHTICNGQRTVKYVNLNDIPVNFKHFPPPKRASKVVWNQELCSDEAIHHTPPPKSLLPRPILQQKPKDFSYPYQEDEPSPIVITKVRRSKSLPRKSREWPW